MLIRFRRSRPMDMHQSARERAVVVAFGAVGTLRERENIQRENGGISVQPNVTRCEVLLSGCSNSIFRARYAATLPSASVRKVTSFAMDGLRTVCSVFGP